MESPAESGPGCTEGGVVAAAELLAPSRGRRFGRIVGPLATLVLFALALLAIRHFLQDHSYAEILAHVRSQSGATLALAIGLTACSYFILTGYDVLALRYVGRPLPYRRVARTSIICYALSHNLGMSALSGGSARYRIYSAWGVTMLEAAKIILFCNLTFWVGFLAVGGPVLIWQAIPIPALGHLPFQSSRTLGVACLVSTLLLVLFVALGPRALRIRGLRIDMPPLGLYLRQIAVASLDWLMAAAVLHAVLPPELGGYFDALGLFLLAQIVAMVSNVPGGMGVFESLLLYLAGDRVGVAELMGALIVYRVIYYLLPLAVAALLLVAQEWRRRHYPAA